MKKLLALLFLGLFASFSNAQDYESEMGLLRVDATVGLYTTKDIRNNLAYGTPDVWGKNATTSYFVNISFFRYKKVEISVALGYQEGRTEIADQMDVDYFTFMPQTRFNWVTSPDNKFELYSSVGTGITSVRENDLSTFNNDASYMIPAFHVNGIGMRFGDKFAIFFEAGFGSKGFMSTGLSYRM